MTQIGPDELTALAARLRPVFDRYQVRQAIVFGSLARGEATRHSDVDLILVLETGKRFLDRYEGVLADITAVTPGRDVDVLMYTPAELAGMADRPFIATALREGKVIYERSQEPPGV